MANEIMFHKCELDDAEGLCELIQIELGYADITVDEVRSSLAKMLSSDDYFTIVAGEDGKIYGYVSAVREVCLEAGEYYRVIGLAVKSEHQGRGLGTALLTLAESNAKAKGARLMTLSSNLRRTKAHQFYEKLGYAKTSYSFKKYL
ncbi:MAG: GNAT family N-acetyltransferase [Oscillospiraceae bacterium]|nr:GNAT family N-acetyltransferase [Oscillospiraceae bacterium]